MNSTVRNVVASATASAIIAGSAVLVSNMDFSNNDVIDWSQYDLNIPALNIPEISLPSVDVANIDKITSLNGTSVSISSLPTTNILNNSSVNVSNVNNVGEINTGKINGISIDDNGMNKLFVNTPDTNAPEVDTHDKDFSEWKAFINKVDKVFVDKRMVSYDPSIIKTNPNIAKWIEIYDKYKDMQPVKYVPITSKFRMISEVLIPKNNKQLNILTQNLAYYKSQGYDSVLVVFTKDDSSFDVLNTVKYIVKNTGINVWLTYGGNESLKESVFMDFDKYTDILKQCAPYITGYINSWRRTSVHLWEQDPFFMNYTNSVLRTYNASLPIVGELYYGNTHKYQGEGNVGFGLNNFKNSSGIMIVNFGFKKIDVKYLMQTILKPYINGVSTIALVVGHKPYYLTDYKNNFGFEKNMLIKHEIQNLFMKYGCVGTITLQNDGKYINTNNLSETLYSQLK